MDNNQNMGQPMDNQGYAQPQQAYDPSQMNYGQPQQDYQQGYPQQQMNYQQPQMNYGQPQMQGYDQSQMQYQQSQQMQQPYGQQMQYQNMQQGYGQPQMQYQNMQQGYGQPQMNYGQPQMPAGPKKPVNKKAIIIAAAVLVVAILAIILVPKLFKDSSKTPFDDIEIGMSYKEVSKKIDMETGYGAEYAYGIEGFGVTGELQIIFDSDEKLDHVNWYVDEDDCDSSKQYEAAIEAIKDYYTDEYGKPEVDEDEYSWELSNDLEYELEINDYGFILRYR